MTLSTASARDLVGGTGGSLMATCALSALRRFTACGLRVAPVVTVVAKLHFSPFIVYHRLVGLRFDNDSVAYHLVLDLLGWARDD